MNISPMRELGTEHQEYVEIDGEYGDGAPLPDSVQNPVIAEDPIDGSRDHDDNQPPDWADDLSDDALLPWEDMDPQTLADIGSRLEEAYVHGDDLSDEELRDTFGVTSSDIAAFRANMDPESASYIDGRREHVRKVRADDAAYEAATVAGLEETAPELLEGHLPADQAAAIGGRYILGFNQTGQETITDAAEYLDELGGVNVTQYGLNQRFEFVEPDAPEHARHTAIHGYYGRAGGGRHVLAVPDSGNWDGYPPSQRPGWIEAADELPEDFILSTEDGKTVVNSRYLAGFIDASGRYHRYPDFMQ